MGKAGLMLVALLLASESPGQAAKGPRVPAGQWAIDYAKDVCILSRDGTGNEPGIAIRTRPFASENDLLLYVPRTGEKARSGKARLSIDGRVVGDERWVSTGEPGRARRLIDTRISIDETAMLAAASSLRLSDGARLDVSVTLPLIAKAMGALRACEIELAGRWGVNPTEMAGWATTVRADTDLRALFWNPNPRASVLLRNPVRALLEIDAVGAVTDCRIVKSSKVAWVDRRFCETLRARATFRPATDPSGKAVAGKFVTPDITSALAR